MSHIYFVGNFEVILGGCKGGSFLEPPLRFSLWHTVSLFQKRNGVEKNARPPTFRNRLCLPMRIKLILFANVYILFGFSLMRRGRAMLAPTMLWNGQDRSLHGIKERNGRNLHRRGGVSPPATVVSFGCMRNYLWSIFLPRRRSPNTSGLRSRIMTLFHSPHSSHRSSSRDIT